MIKAFCPECEHEITRLNYSELRNEYGTYGFRDAVDPEDILHGGDYNSEDSSTETVNFTCEHCDCEVDRFDIVIEKREGTGNNVVVTRCTVGEYIETEAAVRATLRTEQYMDMSEEELDIRINQILAGEQDEILQETTPNTENNTENDESAFSEEEYSKKNREVGGEIRIIRSITRPENSRIDTNTFKCKYCKHTALLEEDDRKKGIRCECGVYVTFKETYTKREDSFDIKKEYTCIYHKT